jgi:glyoxylase-like metal-dependent hydrolase (beta-lactamase superfamily II)
MPMDYFVWAAIGEERSFVVDTGFTAEVAAARGRRHLRCPAEALSLVGLDRNTVADVVLTHLHYDHVGSFARFPTAQFHLQEAELHYTTGHYMRHPFLARSFEVEDIVGIVRLNFARRLRLYRGAVELAPGITLHPVGGHTPGMQFVRVHTRRGWVVLASDVTHYYENMESGRPFTAAFHIGEMLDAYDALSALAPSPQHIVPGHDPLVMRRYPAPGRNSKGSSSPSTRCRANRAGAQRTRSSTALKSSVRRSSRLRAELRNIARQSGPRIRWVPSGGGTPSA